MSLQAFNKLLSLLSPLLKRTSSPISPVIIVGIGIRYLAGGELYHKNRQFDGGNQEVITG